MPHTLSRRSLLQGAMPVVAAASGNAKQAMPMRVLGRTGLPVPIVGLGTGVSFTAPVKEVDRAVEALNLALDLGITYLDTGQSYSDGVTETWMGNLLKHRRKDAIVATKVRVRDGDQALRETEKSLQRMQISQIDVLHIHSLDSMDDLKQIEAKGGLLEALYKLRDEKVTRFIGVSCHYDAEALKTALERHDFDCTQVALNPGLQGWGENGPRIIPMSFEPLILPVARKKNIGVIAMKVTGRGALLGSGAGKSDVPTLLHYALSLPVSMAVIGMGLQDHIRQNAELARTFKPLPKPEMDGLSRRLAAANRTWLERTYRHHQDG